MKVSKNVAFAYQPGPQEYLLKCPADEILYGGARGGGKSYGVLGHFFQHVDEYTNKVSGVLFRRTYAELEDIITKAREMYKDAAEWKDGKKTMIFHKGGILKFRFLERDVDADKYQGHEYSWICIEEAGSFPSQIPINKLKACLRSAAGIKKHFILTANPGGVGHNWIKAEYIDRATPNTIFKVKQTVKVAREAREVVITRVYIPARVQDNKILLKNDPSYINNLVASAGGQDWLLKAWLEGDWNIVAGGMFDDLWEEAIHIVPPFQVPNSWRVYRAFDWGSSRPFSVGWWAVSDGGYLNIDGELRVFYQGTYIRVGEWYGWNGTANTGLRLLESEFIEQLEEREAIVKEKYGIRRIYDGPADSAIFTVQDGLSIADKHELRGISWEIARKGPGSRVHAWQELRQLMSNSKQSPMEGKGLFITEDCLQFKRTVPTAQRDKRNLDDIDTAAEDHICDETGYMVRWEQADAKQVDIAGF